MVTTLTILLMLTICYYHLFGEFFDNNVDNDIGNLKDDNNNNKNGDNDK